MRNFGLIAAALIFFTAAGGQGYFYVYDNDKFAFVREGPGAGFAVVDTVYQLQVVRADSTANGWRQVAGTHGISGWTHSSRLRKMPRETAEYLDDISQWRDIVRTFILAADIPTIVISFSWFYEPYGMNAAFGRDGLSIRPDAETAGVWMLEGEGRMLWEWNPLIPYRRVDIGTDRLVVYGEVAAVSLVKEEDGPYFSVEPFISFEPQDYPAGEIEAALDAAARFAALYYKGDGVSFDFNNEDDNRMMHRLRSAYFRGDPRAADLYPLVLGTMRSDGSGSQEKLEYDYELWIHRNRGLVSIADAAEFWN